MHSIAISAARRSRESGGTTANSADGASPGSKYPFASPFVEEHCHLDREVFDDWQVAQRLELQPLASAPHVDDARAAGPARNAVDDHRAGAAHADAAGKAIGETRILRALDFGDRVEDRLALAQRQRKRFEMAVAIAAPDVEFERIGLHEPT